MGANPAHWPVRLRAQTPSGEVVLRPIRKQDERVWQRLRGANKDWLQPWEATSPFAREPNHRPASFAHYVTEINAEAKAGNLLPFVIELNTEFCGQITVSGIQYGSLWTGSVGYWITKNMAGQGVIPSAVAMVTDYCFNVIGLHRLEINIRPENARSLRVVEKLGFRDEGMRQAYLHIQGQWADHRTFALVAEDVPTGVFARWMANWPGK